MKPSQPEQTDLGGHLIYPRHRQAPAKKDKSTYEYQSLLDSVSHDNHN